MASARSRSRGRLPVVQPRTRGECAGLPRPCLFVSCRYHLYLDLRASLRSIRLNFPGREVWELEASCALDVAEDGGATLEEVGNLLGLTRERVRQIESEALARIREGLADDEADPKRQASG